MHSGSDCRLFIKTHNYTPYFKPKSPSPRANCLKPVPVSLKYYKLKVLKFWKAEVRIGNRSLKLGLL